MYKINQHLQNYPWNENRVYVLIEYLNCDDMATKYGSVIYKIGEFGDIKQAGSKFDSTAEAEGVIYISIYETVYDKGNSGSYTVKVTKK